MVAARKRENQNRINYKIYLFFYGKEILQYYLISETKCADQTARMLMLLCAFVVRIWQKRVFS